MQGVIRVVFTGLITNAIFIISRVIINKKYGKKLYFKGNF